MFRPDAGNFNRFLTTLGLLLVAASLVIPYFFFKNTAILELPEPEIQQMTATGQNSIRARQDAIVALEPWAVALSVTAALLGVSLLVTGGIRLKKAQADEDEEGRLRRHRARMEIREQSPGEQARRAEEKASAEVGDSTQPSPAAGGTPSGEGPVVPVPTRAAMLARIPDQVRSVFAQHEPATHQLNMQVTISSSEDTIRVDGLFESQVDQLDDVILELAVSDPSTIPKNARNRANELIAIVSRYRNISRNTARGWLVVVVPTAIAKSRGVETLEEAGVALRRALGKFGSATVIAEDELSTLPDLFAFDFGAGSTGRSAA
jgi:hypothetical protein